MSTHELQEVCSGDTFSPIVGVKQPKERLFAPADLGPLILAVLCIVMCLFAGLLAYFLIQNAELQKSRETLSLRAATGTDLLQRQIANALGLVASLKTYMYLRDGDALAVDQRNEFDVFCNGRGSFPKEVFYFSYLAIIPDANATSWILAMRNKGSDYANFNMTFRDASNNVIPAPYAPEHYVAALTSPLTFIATNGYDNAPSSVRNASIQTAIRTGQPTAGPKVIFSITSFTSQPGFNVYQSVMSRTVPPKPVGIVLTGFRAGDLIQTALDSTTKDVAVNVYDMNATDATSSFMYSTNQWESKTGYYTDIPASQAQSYINAAPFTTTTTVTVADRTFRLVFMPTASLISANETTTKIFVLTAALVVMVVLLLGCLALFFIGRLYRKKRSFTRMLRRLDTERLSLLESNKLKLEQLLNQIAQQEYKTRLINNSIPDQIIVITDEGKITQTNTSFDKAFNFTEIEFEKGVDIYSIFPELEKDFFANQRGAVQTTARTRFGTNLNMTIIAKSLKKEGTLYNDGELEAFVIIAKAVGVSEREEAVVQEKVIPMMKQFEHDWRHESSRKRLVEFAKKEINEENLHFLERVTMYKKLPLEQRVDMQRQIYEKFVLNGGELQLNVDVELAKTLAIKMGKSLGDLSLFDEVEDFVRRMVVQDIYPRFVTEEKNRSIQSSSESSLTA